jgi:hypothetical protein
MHRLLGSLLAALLLAAALGACADDGPAEKGRDPGPSGVSGSPTSSDAGTGTGDPEFELVDTITVTSAGGQLSDTAVPLSDDAAVQSFVGQFTGEDLGAQVEDEVAKADVPSGHELYGAVVAIGCDAPDDVTVARSGSDVVITAVKVPSPKSECFAPMTTVALVLVPTAAA